MSPSLGCSLLRSRHVLAIAALLLAIQTFPSAHEKKSVGQIRLTIGWGEEPAFTGFKNSVEVDVADAAGVPLSGPGGSLSVEISFGSDRISLPMLPAMERPGKFRAWLVPTRSGTYAFHITGTIKGETIDTTSTCAAQTFACVTDAADLQFPAKDPSAGQLAQGIERALPRADQAMETAATARNIGIAAFAAAALALAAAIGLGVRKGRKGA